MDNIMPVLEVKARQCGWCNIPSSYGVRPERRQTLGLRWLTRYSRERNEKTMKEKTSETKSLTLSTVQAVQLRNVKILTRWLKTNRAFAHYRW